MKKLIAGILCAVLVLGTALSLSGCGDKNYPVKIANLTIDKEPKSIVVLDPNSADIISYMGYDVKIVGRSREVDQKYLGVAPVMGSAVSPSVQDIIDSGATVVFANEGLNDDFEQSLEKEGIAVIKMSVAETPKQLETNYHTIGKILGGNDDGDAKAASSYDKLISAMEQRKSEASAKNATALDTVCYLYYEQGGLRLMTSGTYGDMLLGYTGSVNVAVNIDENKVDVNTLKVANPKYIFYADDSTLKAVQADPVLSKLAAVTGGKTMQITKDEMSRQGLTALETLEKMIGFIHPELAKAQKATEPTQQTETKPAETQAATQAATEAATQAAAQTAATQAATQPAAATSVADKYKIDLKDLSLKEEDDNDDVKAMQQRLFDLGYVSDKENITGYFGEISKKAVSARRQAESRRQARRTTPPSLSSLQATRKSPTPPLTKARQARNN